MTAPSSPLVPRTDDEELTCEFGRYDQDGNAIEECHEPDYVEVDMPDHGIVRLCRRHLGWSFSLGRASMNPEGAQ